MAKNNIPKPAVAGRFVPQFTEAQRVACTRAILEAGMTYRATQQAAEAGELYGLPPFDSPHASTIKGWVQREKDRQGIGPENEGVPALEGYAERILLRALRQVEARQKTSNGKVSGAELVQILKAVRELKALKTDGKASPRDTPTTRTLLAELDAATRTAETKPRPRP